ncbi:glycosyltransferase family 4 protein [Candidatus Dojkabacteria bacterium]|nr:glycosyltransferase family 4 protein [Candidatus Dojkabacteria bacterium]
MKAAIYNQYLDTLGGGERYTIEFCKVLAESGYDVDVQWQDGEILQKISNRFGIKLPKNIKVVEDVKKGKDYDVCFWVSDGSIPNLMSRRNFIHFQVPFKNVNGKSLLNKMKLFRVERIVCNSVFTKKVIDQEFGVDSVVLYPPIDVDAFKPKRKENIILYVGRFSNLLQSKGQDVLIEAYKRMHTSGFKDYKLVLAGGVEVGADEYVKKLEKMSKNFPIEIVKSPRFSDLKDLFGKAKIFWSASGFGINEVKNPQAVEHFGMTLVEAMSAGCVPIVANVGGHKEIVENGISGFLWDNMNDLVKATKRLTSERGLIYKISNESKNRSKVFSSKVFKEKICKEIIKN